MTDHADPNRTVDEAPADPLDAGLALAFGPDSGPPLAAAGSAVRALGAAPVQLRQPPTEPADPVARPHSDAIPAAAPPRLRIDGEIARGGMGAVLKGRDVDLGRDVAVKVLLEAHQGKTELVQRFVEEAQIAGQLQHPGVVPVYELGQFPDRRPYFTMKLVKGQTLAALLAARKDPAEDRPRLVGIFGQVCQTLAYAHARGVIHRDLKPSNVMVGNFGEVQVMDWGLAKVLRQGGIADEQKAHAHPTVSVIQTQRSAGAPDVGSHTQAGSVLGTPGYMAPEQARAEGDLVDERADVFGLGAILCEVLTGQPPFKGPRAEAMRKARTAQLDDALRRLDGCGADAELIGLARRCLAAEPWDRPRDAGAVAAAVTAYQDSVAERLRRAELARAAEAARAQEARATAAAERKARRRTRALAASVFALVAVAAAGGLWGQRQWAERTAEAVRQREAVETALGRAGELQQQARWAEARAVLEQTRDRLGEAGPEDLRRRVERAAADVALVDRLDGIRLRRSAWVEGNFDYRGAERDYAATFREADLGVEGDDPEAVAARLRASAVGEQLVAALDDWAAVTRDPKRRVWLLEVARRADPDDWRERFRDPRAWRERAGLEALAKELLGDERQLARQKPPLLAALGLALLRMRADAVPLLAAAQARYPDDFWLNFDLGGAFYLAKRWDEAVAFWRAAVAVRPSAAAAHGNLGAALCDKGQLDEAVRECRTAIDLDPNYAKAHSNLGNALREKGQLDEAVREYRTAIGLDPHYAPAHSNCGNTLRAKGQLEEAIRECRTAIDLDPKLASAHSNLGAALGDKGQLDEAVRECRTATDLDPKDAKAHNNLGNALYKKGQLDEAIRECRTATDLDPKDAIAHTNLGAALRAKGQLDEAIRECRTAISLDPKSAPAHSNLGAALGAKGQPDEAIRECRTAIGLDPKDAIAHTNLGAALREKGQLEEAIRECRTAIDLDPKLAPAHGALGQALLQHGRFAEAREATRHALDLLQASHPLRQFATRQLQQCEQSLALDQKLPAILEGTEVPANDAERLALARLCQQPFKKRYAAAARFYAEALAHDARVAGDLRQRRRYNAACAAALAGCGQGEDARALPDKDTFGLRRQALGWLRADLAAYAQLAGRDDPAAKQTVRQRLEYWRQDADLAPVRDPVALDKLPDDERQSWRQLWDDVGALLKKVEETK
jgi:serine/threonine-protein kinase